MKNYWSVFRLLIFGDKVLRFSSKKIFCLDPKGTSSQCSVWTVWEANVDQEFDQKLLTITNPRVLPLAQSGPRNKIQYRGHIQNGFSNFNPEKASKRLNICCYTRCTREHIFCNYFLITSLFSLITTTL